MTLPQWVAVAIGILVTVCIIAAGFILLLQGHDGSGWFFVGAALMALCTITALGLSYLGE